MKKKKIRRKYVKIIIFLLLSIFVIVTVYQNRNITNTFYKLQFDNLPAGFSGFRIAQVSDFHNASFGENNAQLIDSLKENRPDIIVITGDFIDSNHTDIQVALEFIKQAHKIAPCYFVTGNHEAWIEDQYEELEKDLLKLDVIVLRNEKISLSQAEDNICLIGVDDPAFSESDSRLQDSVMDSQLEEITIDKHKFTILLSHRPELFDVYVANDIDLVFSGHAHGGQVRIPFVGGLVAPNQGLFPKYDSGIYEQGNTKMVVSRGIGNSLFPIRINDRPELVYVDLIKREAG